MRWQWLSNDFPSPEPFYSERRRFPKPRVLRRDPSQRELSNGVTQLGIDADGRRVLERQIMHSPDGILRTVVYDRLEPDLVRAVCCGYHDLEYAWCARVADRRPLTHVHVAGSAERYCWEGGRLIRVERFERLDRRPRRGAVEELTFDLLGTLICVDHVATNGTRTTTYRRKARGESVKTVGAALRKELVRAIPELIERAAITEPAYALAVTWTGACPAPPFIGVGLERERERWRETGDESVWAAPEWELFASDRLTLDDPNVQRVGQRLRELIDMSSSWTAHVKVYREIARDLNALDWSELLPVTDDFVVFPSDLELVGLASHLRLVLGKDRARELQAAMGCPPPA